MDSKLPVDDRRARTSRPTETTGDTSFFEAFRAAVTGPERATAIVAAACLAALAALYWPSLVQLVTTWSRDDNYGHGFIVPLLSLYFASEAYSRGPIASSRRWGVGITLLVVSILGRLAITLVPIGIIGDLSFILGIAGIVGVVLGHAALVRYRFALFFLVFMVPLPIALYSLIASPLQRMVSAIAAGILTAGGIPVLCQGNMITLPGDLQLFVAEACSGMRQLTGFLALATAVAWLLPRPMWYRATLIFSSVPIAIAANVLRVTLTAWSAYAISPDLSKGWFHTFEGLIMMGVGLAILAAECALLNRLAQVQTEPRTALPQHAASSA